jgi:hypothetical protein
VIRAAPPAETISSSDHDLRGPGMSTDEENGGLGGRFFLGLAGVVLGLGIVLFVGLILFTRAVYAWGFLGAFGVLFLALILIGLFYDRRHAADADALIE